MLQRPRTTERMNNATLCINQVSVLLLFHPTRACKYCSEDLPLRSFLDLCIGSSCDFYDCHPCVAQRRLDTLVVLKGFFRPILAHSENFEAGTKSNLSDTHHFARLIWQRISDRRIYRGSSQAWIDDKRAIRSRWTEWRVGLKDRLRWKRSRYWLRRQWRQGKRTMDQGVACHPHRRLEIEKLASAYQNFHVNVEGRAFIWISVTRSGDVGFIPCLYDHRQAAQTVG